MECGQALNVGLVIGFTDVLMSISYNNNLFTKRLTSGAANLTIIFG